jgi:phage-related minor tail protein
MDDGLEQRLVAVRADTAGFARDVATMRATLEGGLGDGAGRAGRLVEGALLRAVRTGKLGFDDLKATALATLDQIAAASLKGAVAHVLPGGGLGAILASVLGGGTAGTGGLPGRATGGPVAPGRAYVVGERGPEVFVPSASGRIEAGAVAGAVAAPREVRVAITVSARGGEAPAVLARSTRQVARAVRAALEE